MTRPGLCFVGTGGMGQQAHLANYAQLRDAGQCEIAGVVDLQRDLAGAVAARCGVRQASDWVREKVGRQRESRSARTRLPTRRSITHR